MSAFITELLGTFFLVLVATLSGGDPLAIGSALMVLIYAGAHTSGGHYNGCITFGLWLRGVFETRHIGRYIAAQLLGASAAALFAWGLLGRAVLLAPAAHLHPALALALEALLTLVMVWVSLHVATDKRAHGNPYYGLAIGFTVFAAVAAAKPWGCGVLNPTSALALSLVESLDSGRSLSSLWLYTAGPMLGSAAAALLFRLQVERQHL